ncbi:hypothetical protein EAI_04862, partial [Harpegnathos saltator]
ITVNRRKNLVDPVTSAYTQNIERLQRDTRAAIPRNGIRISITYESCIAEFISKRQIKLDDRSDSFF